MRDDAPESTAWRRRGRALCALGLLAIAAAQVARGAGEATTSLDAATLLACGLSAAIYGGGAKLADLTAEHGLRSRPLRALGYGAMALGLLALAPFAAGATMIASEVAFHGVIKGKADTRAHVTAGAAVLGLLVAAFALLPVGRVDGAAVALTLAVSLLWMGVNNRWLRLGDHPFHQVRGDVIGVCGVLALVDPPRWLPFALVVASEHVAYALTKAVARRAPWYRDVRDASLCDPGPLGLAFHARDPRRERTLP